MGRVGDEMARLRKAQNLTQKQLAKKLGVAENYIADVESGKRVMQDQLASRVTKLLGGHFDSEVPEVAEPEPVRRPVGVSGSQLRPDVTRPSGQLVYSTEEESPKGKGSGEATQAVWSEAFGQMLREVPVYDAGMIKQTGTRTMAVVAGKVENQPKEKVFWLQADDNDMIGYRIQRTDHVFAVQTSVLSEDGIYLIEMDNKRLMRHLKQQPGGMVQVSCHKGTMVREIYPYNLFKVVAHLLRVEVRLA